MIYTYGSISFREPRIDDAKIFHHFLSDNAEVRRCLFGWIGELSTVENEKSYLEKQIAGNQSGQYYVILDRNGSLIGSCSIFDWDPRAQRCSIGIYIGDSNARGKGHGSDAIELLLLIAFTELNCKKVKLSVYGYNASAIRLYEKKGFIREGTLKNEVFTGGTWHDEHLYAVFYDKWLERVRIEGRAEKV